MDTHVKVLGVLQIALSSLFLLGALVLTIILGGAAASVGASGDREAAEFATPIIGIAGTFLIVLLVSLAVPGIAAGIGLLYRQRWARVLAIILSAIHLINFPLGTFLGAYGLWVLLSKETEAVFNPAARAAG